MFSILRSPFRRLHRPSQTASFSTKVGYFGVCEDRNSSFLRGPAEAPPLIREAFHSDAFNGHCEYGFNVRNEDILKDFGDIGLLGESFDFPTLRSAIEERMRGILEEDRVPFCLGGDHSITYPLVDVLVQLRKEVLGIERPLTILHFDAHGDIYPCFEGNPYSHASPFSRILENDLCHNLIQIGVRTITPDQKEQMVKYSTVWIDAKDFPYSGKNLEPILASHLQHDVHDIYLTVDMDVLDPSVAPGVSHREFGGLSAGQLIDSILCIPGKIVGADLVEYNPTVDIDGITATCAGKLFQEMIGKIVDSNKQCS